ncbi:MAG: ECF-type sigma factor, partial [Planctomycetota bacterium]
RQTSEKRGGGPVRGHSIVQKSAAPQQSCDGRVADEPTPELLASMEERYVYLLGLLNDDVQKEIVRQKLAGHLNKDIAKTTGISLRSVERKLEVIRDTWVHAIDEPE